MKKYISLLVISVCIAFISITVYATDETKILDFKKVTADVDDVGDNSVIKGIDEYDYRGSIDGIYNNRIVISDRSYDLSSESLIRGMDGEILELYLIKKGRIVYFSLDDNNTITEMLVE
ncbi:MAG: hypothetical protein K8R67_08435 [Desulfobacteraceae bacterium]|nr:hypothetical protein [Desulfobacteraceae bacterium]